MADVLIEMDHPPGEPARLRPVRVTGAVNQSAVGVVPQGTTEVTEKDTVRWSGPAGKKVTVHFVHGPSPFGDKTEVSPGEFATPMRRGLFPYDVVMDCKLFVNGGGLEVGPR